MKTAQNVKANGPATPSRAHNRDSSSTLKDAQPLLNSATSERHRTGEPVSGGPLFLQHLVPARVSVAYATYWYFASERQEVFFRRFHRTPWPWSDDEIFRTYKFTNAYRASDRVSQYLIRNVIYRSDLPDSPDEIVFRVLLFKFFNRVHTWELLEREIGPITLEDYSFDRYSHVLDLALSRGQRIYSAAYIMPPGRQQYGYARKHQHHLRLLESMMNDNLADRLAGAPSMQVAFEVLRDYPSLGDFLAYQYIVDLNYSEVIDFDEMDFVVPGPGARRGLRKCFTDLGGLNEFEVIKLMADEQEREFERYDLEFKSLWGRRLHLVDCQNIFCEVDKYTRVSHPNISGGGRRRIKQKFRPDVAPIDWYFPPKWNLNKFIDDDLHNNRSSTDKVSDKHSGESCC